MLVGWWTLASAHPPTAPGIRPPPATHPPTRSLPRFIEGDGKEADALRNKKFKLVGGWVGERVSGRVHRRANARADGCILSSCSPALSRRPSLPPLPSPWAGWLAGWFFDVWSAARSLLTKAPAWHRSPSTPLVCVQPPKLSSQPDASSCLLCAPPPQIPNIPKGSWIVRQSVGTTPVLLGQKLTTRYFRGPNYFEAGLFCCFCMFLLGLLGACGRGGRCGQQRRQQAFYTRPPCNQWFVPLAAFYRWTLTSAAAAWQPA